MSDAVENPPVQISIDHAKCKACGLCVKLCKEGPFSKEEGYIRINTEKDMSCFFCGQCMAICPLNGITVVGPGISPKNIVELPPQETRANYDQLKNLMLARRSMREYLDRPVEQELIQKILDAVATAPIGLPPSTVRALVWNGKHKVQSAARDFFNSMRACQWHFSPPMLALMRPFMPKETSAFMKNFVAPMIKFYLDGEKQKKDFLLYHAPLAIYFYAKSSEDALIAATYAMLAAESLALGSCMIGFPPRLFQRDKNLCLKYNIPHPHEPGMMLILGYPRFLFQRAIQRNLDEVRYC